MMRIGQEWLRGVAAMAGLANDTTDTPRRRLRRARGAKRSGATRQPLRDAQAGAGRVA